MPKNSYLHDLPIIKYMSLGNRIKFKSPVTFFVGENGTGKSTILESIAISSGFNAEGGSKDFYFSTRNSHSKLHDFLTTVKTVSPKDGFFLRAESFYNVASYLDLNSTLLRYGGESLHNQSHGESFLSLMTNRFDGNGLYLLDEPESALSPQKILGLIYIIINLVNRNSQFIIATHSPILMACPRSTIFQFSQSGIQEVNYRETEHYKFTKQFLNEPERMIQYVLD